MLVKGATGVFTEAVALTDERCNIAKEVQAIKNNKARLSRERYAGTINSQLICWNDMKVQICLKKTITPHTFKPVRDP